MLASRKSLFQVIVEAAVFELAVPFLGPMYAILLPIMLSYPVIVKPEQNGFATWWKL